MSAQAVDALLPRYEDPVPPGHGPGQGPFLSKGPLPLKRTGLGVERIELVADNPAETTRRNDRGLQRLPQGMASVLGTKGPKGLSARLIQSRQHNLVRVGLHDTVNPLRVSLQIADARHIGLP